MIAATRVVLDRPLLWALIGTLALGAVAALVAAIAALRAARAARRTLGRLDALRSLLGTPPSDGRAGDVDAPAAGPGAPEPYRIEVREPIRPDAGATGPMPSAAPVAGGGTEPTPRGARAEPFVAGPARRGAVPPPAIPTPGVPPLPPVPGPGPSGSPADPRLAGQGRAEPWFVQRQPPADDEAVRDADEAAAAARRRRLEDPDPFVRIEAIVELRGQPDVLDALFRALQDEYPVVRRQAVRALRDAGGTSATRALIEVANQDPSAEVREEAVAALASVLRETRSDHG